MSELLISQEEYLEISNTNRGFIAEIFGSIRQNELTGIASGMSNPTDAFVRAYYLLYNAVCITSRMMTIDWNVADSLIAQMSAFDTYLGDTISGGSTADHYFCDNIWNASHVYDVDLEFTEVPADMLSNTYVVDWKISSVNIHTLDNIFTGLSSLERNIYNYRASLEEFSRIECIEGELADALRSYFIEVHGALMNALADVVRTLYANLSAYCVSYSTNFMDSFYYLEQEELERNVSSLGAAVNVLDDVYPDIAYTLRSARSELTPVAGARYIPQSLSESYRNTLESSLSNSISTIQYLRDLVDGIESTGSSLAYAAERNATSYLGALSHISSLGGYRLLEYQSGSIFDPAQSSDSPYAQVCIDLGEIDMEGVAEVTNEDAYWLTGCVDEDGNFDSSYADGLTTYLIDNGVDPDSISDGTFESLADVIHQLREAGYDDGAIAAMINNDLQGTVDMLNEYASANGKDQESMINGLILSDIQSWSDYSEYSDVFAQIAMDNLSEEELADLMNFIHADEVTQLSYSASERAHYLALLASAGEGYQEYNYNGEPGDGNQTFVGDYYNKPGVPWCAMYTTWCMSVCGYLNDGSSIISGVTSDNAIANGWASVSNIRSDFISEGSYHQRSSGYVPAVGDAVIFGGGSHIGIVIGVDTENGIVYTSEGNSSDQVSVRRYSLDNSNISGYCSLGGTEQDVRLVPEEDLVENTDTDESLGRIE